jgi:hypothetical protein
LRFAWHITTVAWWGFAAILLLLARLRCDVSGPMPPASRCGSTRTNAA